MSERIDDIWLLNSESCRLISHLLNMRSTAYHSSIVLAVSIIYEMSLHSWR